LKKILLLGLIAGVLNAESILEYDGEMTGYFNDTKIIRYIDKKYNVVCYELTPETISTSSSYNSVTKKSSIVFKGDLGSLSCVKLFPFSK